MPTSGAKGHRIPGSSGEEPKNTVLGQDTVNYITSSAAGFYVFGMRLTTGMIVKFLYVWCIIMVGLLTRLGSDD